jgi:hypothetical protein
MKKTRYAYAAGLVDGEGSISLIYTSGKARFRLAEVSVASTTPEIVEWLHAHFNMCVLTTHQAHSRLPILAAKLRCAAAVRFLTKILPYLRHPEKRHRARLLVENYARLVLPGRCPPERVKARLAFERAFFDHPLTQARQQQRPQLRPVHHKSSF